MIDLGIIENTNDKNTLLILVEIKTKKGQVICYGKVHAHRSYYGSGHIEFLVERAISKGVDLSEVDLSETWTLPKNSGGAKLRGMKAPKYIGFTDLRGADLREIDFSKCLIGQDQNDRPMIDENTRLEGSVYPPDFFWKLNEGDKILLHLREKVKSYGFGNFDTPFSKFEGRGLDLTKIPAEYLDACARAGYTYIMGLDMSASHSWYDFPTVSGNGYCHKVIGTRGTGNSGTMILAAKSKRASENLRIGRVHLLMAEYNLSFADAQLIEETVIRRQYGREIISLIIDYLRKGSCCTKQVWDAERDKSKTME